MHINIKEQFPNAWKKCVEWYGKEIITEVASEKIAQMAIEYASRSLYDFFDENQIFINLCGDPVAKWDFTIYNGIRTKSLIKYKDRISCEKDAFVSAFKLMEGDRNDIRGKAL